MEQTDKQEILDAFSALVAHVDERMDGMEERMANLTQEVRSRFDKVELRLDSLEESVGAMSRALDTITEGDVLGKEHITLTRPEYDALVTVAHLPNRFKGAH
jgi:hypothetical protein